MAIKEGSTVRWRSSSGGNTKVKIGRVVLVVEPKEDIYWAAGRLACRLFGRENTPFALKAEYTFATDLGALPRDHESYLVSVPRGKMGKAKPALYWPRVSALEEVSA